MSLTTTTTATAAPVIRGRHRQPMRGTTSLGFGIPAALLLVAMAIYPLIVLFRMSFSDVGPTNIIGHWSFVGLENFQAALTTSGTWKAMGRTLGLSAVLLVSNLVIGFITAAVLSTPGRLTNIVLGIMVFVWALPPLVSGSVWKFLLDDAGALNAVIGVLGLPPVSWLSSPTGALWTVSLVVAWASLPFSALVLRGGLMAIPHDIIEAAAIDGASYWRTQAQIVLPLLRPTMWILAILTVIYSFKSFDFFYVLTQGGPSTATNTLPVLSYYTAFSQFDMSTGATVAVISMVIVAVFAVPYVRSINAEETE